MMREKQRRQRTDFIPPYRPKPCEYMVSAGTLCGESTVEAVLNA